MSIHTADAIVLRQYAYRETSLLVTCLTDQFGKIRGLIKGLRGERHRFSSPMELFTLNRIVFYDHRNSPLHLISQCDLIEPYRALPHELETMRAAACCAELVDALTEDDEPIPSVFHLMKATLDDLNEARRPASDQEHEPAVRVHFILRLLRLVGFQPQLDECVACAEPVAARRGFWSVRQGGVLCERCLHHDSHAEPIAPEQLEALTSCAEADEPQPLHPGQARSMQRRLEEFLRWRIDRPLKTLAHGSRSQRVPVPQPVLAGGRPASRQPQPVMR